jgi:hypothetical protein
MYVVHVGCSGADIFSRDVPPPKTFDRTTMCSEDCFPILRAIVSDDDGLSAAEIQAGNRVLVCHAARESQRVDHRSFV